MINKKIFLIGFMGCGKTYLSELIANNLKLNKIDLDKEIEKIEQKNITNIFKLNGENYFRQKENEILQKIINNNNFVLACGGGTPCYFNNMQIMNNQGLTIWINENLNVIFERLKKEKEKRPLISKMTDSELQNFIQIKNNERIIFYKKAKLIIYKTENIIKYINTYYEK